MTNPTPIGIYLAYNRSLAGTRLLFGRGDTWAGSCAVNLLKYV